MTAEQEEFEERPIEVGDWVRHEVGRNKPTVAEVKHIQQPGLLLVQTPGEGFGKFVPVRAAELVGEP